MRVRPYVCVWVRCSAYRARCTGWISNEGKPIGLNQIIYWHQSMPLTSSVFQKVCETVFFCCRCRLPPDQINELVDFIWKYKNTINNSNNFLMTVFSLVCFDFISPHNTGKWKIWAIRHRWMLGKLICRYNTISNWFLIRNSSGARKSEIHWNPTLSFWKISKSCGWGKGEIWGILKENASRWGKWRKIGWKSRDLNKWNRNKI